MNPNIWLSTVVAVWLGSCDTASAHMCKNPKPGLKSGEASVESHPLSFTASGRRYSIDIYSKFEPVPDKSYCILYEADNKTDTVAKFFWETAGFDEPRLEVGRHSLYRKVPPGRPPVVNDTIIYAFTTTKIDAAAYSRPLRQASSSAAPLSELKESDPARVRLSDAIESGDIGTAYRGPTFELTARSFVKGGRGKFAIIFFIEAGSTVKAVRAPYVSMLGKMPANLMPTMMAASIGEFEQTPLTLVNQGLVTSAPFVAKQEDWLYVVEHPILVEHEKGISCIIAMGYSTTQVLAGRGCGIFEK